MAQHLAAETADAVACKFDPDEGFALNDSARAYCVAQWAEDGNSHRNAQKTRRSTFRVDFGVLREATNDFDKEHLLGEGGCSLVFKGDVYGYTTAIKVFKETEGAWVSDVLLCKARDPLIIRSDHLPFAW